jgi:hypothetical protein
MDTFVYLKPTLVFGDVEWKPWYAVILQACNLVEGTLLDLGRPQAAVMYHIPLYYPYKAILNTTTTELYCLKLVVMTCG